jgi:hypothetical protein
MNSHGSTLRSLFSAAATAGAVLLVTACSGGSLPSGAIPAAPQANLSQTPASRLGIGPAKMFQFTTLDDQADPTFNQLLGINDHGKIAGYFGSGVLPAHPNQGYTLVKPYGQNDYKNENYPGSVETQVTAINDRGDTAGFWVDANNVNRGFVQWKGVFTSYTDPKTHGGTVNQILGLNNAGIAVGFYTDANGVNHGFTLNQATGKFTPVTPPGGGSVQATAINNAGDIAGIVTSSAGSSGFLRKGKSFSALSFPSGSNTQPFGLNDADQMVGSYDDGGGVMHGFLVSNPLVHAKWTSIDDPNGIGSTVVNGLNNHRELVGFYTDAAGNTDGMLIQP